METAQNGDTLPWHTPLSRWPAEARAVIGNPEWIAYAPDDKLNWIIAQDEAEEAGPGVIAEGGASD